MAARQCVPVFGPHISDPSISFSPSGESWLSPRRFQLSLGYRYQHSHRHFVGTREQIQRAANRSEVNNIIHILDLSATYDVNSRFNLSVSVPFFFSKRFGQSTPDRATHARGVGDISLTGRVWLFKQPNEARRNISVGLGVKFPTGKPDVKDTVITPTGPVVRNVDQSIQLGDGGYGMTVDFQAYQAVKSVRLYATGVYLINPRNTNGVLTGRTRPSEGVMSVADQYLYRAGAIMPFPKTNSLVWSLGVRGEGVPSTDFLGKSDGFRRPGYVISVEPGLIYNRGKDTWSFSVPVPFVRARTRSVPDVRENRHGDAAFADYLIIAGYTRRF